MTCKECICFKMCRMTDDLFFTEEIANSCDSFKNKSRFVELPCKVGDTVYDISFGLIYGRGEVITECIVQRFDINESETVIVTYIPKLKRRYGVHDYSFGKTVFLTRAEAEKALKEREMNGV